MTGALASLVKYYRFNLSISTLNPDWLGLGKILWVPITTFLKLFLDIWLVGLSVDLVCF